MENNKITKEQTIQLTYNLINTFRDERYEDKYLSFEPEQHDFNWNMSKLLNELKYCIQVIRYKTNYTIKQAIEILAQKYEKEQRTPKETTQNIFELYLNKQLRFEVVGA